MISKNSGLFAIGAAILSLFCLSKVCTQTSVEPLYVSLDAIEQTLTTFLTLNAKPPEDMDRLAAFYAEEHQLDPSAPKIDPDVWVYSTRIQADAESDPTDLNARGFVWRYDTFQEPISRSWLPVEPQKQFESRWMIQPRGLVINFQHKKQPAVRMLKWLPVSEQIKMADSGTPEQVLRILHAWYQHIPYGGCGTEYFQSILPYLLKATKSNDQKTRDAAFRCIGKAMELTDWNTYSIASPSVKTIVEAMKELFNSNEENTRIHAVDIINLLPYRDWLPLLSSMSESEPHIRKMAAIALFQLTEYPAPHIRGDERKKYFVDAGLFKTLYRDTDRNVRLEVIRLMGKHTSRFAGSLGEDYIDRSFRDIVLEILKGNDIEKKKSLLKGMEYSDLLYLDSGSVPGSVGSQIRTMIEDLGSHPDLELRFFATCLLPFEWPKSFEQVKPFLSSKEPEYLRRVGKALIALMPAQEAHDAYLKLAQSLDDKSLIYFLNIDEHIFTAWDYRVSLTPSERVALFEKWIQSPEPRIRCSLVYLVSHVLRKKNELSEKEQKALSDIRDSLLNDPDVYTKVFAAQAFLRSDKDALLAWIQRQDDPARRDATLQFGTAERIELKDELLRILHKGDASSRWEAHNRLLEMGVLKDVDAYKKTLHNRYKIQKALNDIRALAVGVTSYFIDWGQGLYELPSLTAQIAYVNVLPHDPFQSGPVSRYSFYRPNKQGPWCFLQGVGPDGINSTLPLISNITELLNKGDYESSQKVSNILMTISYDPTNGILSFGDLLSLIHL